MTVYEWPAELVGEKFGNAELGFQENTVTVKYESGRSVSHMANARALKKMKLKILVDRRQSMALAGWIGTTLASGVYPFHSPRLDIEGRKTAWKFSTIPAVPLSGKTFSLQLELEEVYL